jgi:hypothetical protein
VITSTDPSDFRITDAQKAVTGRIDAQRTKVTVNGVPATVADLKVAAKAKGELCLDDVWVTIDIH